MDWAEELNEKYGAPTSLTNGLVLAAYTDLMKTKMSSVSAATKLLAWLGKEEEASPRVFQAKILRTVKKASGLRDKNLDTFKKETFVILELVYSDPSPTTVPSTSSAPDTPLSFPSLPPTRSKNVATPQKQINTSAHELAKKDRRIRTLEGKLKRMEETRGHYSLKNVKKREARSAEVRMILRKEKSKLVVETRRQGDEVEKLTRKLQEVKKKNAKLEKKVKQQRKNLMKIKRAAKSASRRARYHSQTHTKKKMESMPQVMQVEGEEEEMERVIETKKKDGEFTDRMRFCVMELVGLDVATGKVQPVIETVGAMCGVKFSSVPSRTACQRIVDEGQVLAKSYIKECVIKRSSKFGVHKDGTTRRKVKIVDTSINTDAGESFCLGWSSVVSETGKAIADEMKDKLEEIAGGSSDGKFMVEMLGKLEYFMSDRAENEKKSSRLLEEWREEMLKSNGKERFENVHHLYCAAHVLLGFHSYTIKAIKKLDYFPQQELKHPVVLMLKDASDLFGPVGDYRGLRNQWEAFCLERGVQSTIKSYKDNRFNALFEVAAQVYHHRRDFLNLLEAQPSRNAKQNRLYKALQSSQLITLIECLGLFFHSVTGPFWTMVTSSKTSHQTFRSIILKLKDSLQKCSCDPNFFFTPDSFSFLKFGTSSSKTKEGMAKSVKGGEMMEMMKAISDGLLGTIDAQLKDVLSDGTNTDVMAPLTNLICERHFGHLDVSQRRRPHSSLHHHSSVILLKQTRKRMRGWYDDLASDEKENLWKRARGEGKELRRKHQEHDRGAIVDSLKKLKLCPGAMQGDVQEELKEGRMIAVACQEAWYPALVQSTCPVDQDIVTVNFAGLGKTLGSFHWPTGKDIQAVSRQSVVETSVEYGPRAGGRYWRVENAKAIEEKFKKYK